MNLSPQQDLVLIEPVHPENLIVQEDESLGIKNKAQKPETPIEWRVVAAGPGTYSTDGTFIPNFLSPGDRFMFLNARNRTYRDDWKTRLVIEGREYLALRVFDPGIRILKIEEKQ